MLVRLKHLLRSRSAHARTPSIPPRPAAEPLEPRILYSADPFGASTWLVASAEVRVVGADALPLASDPVVVDETSAVAATDSVRQVRHEIVFVDSQVRDYAQLVNELTASAGGQRELQVVVIAAGEDGLAVIGRTLAAQPVSIDAVHIVSHGQDGAVQLGRTMLDAATAETRSTLIASWAAALSEDADLLIYGCDVAATPGGHQLMSKLATLTGADVAASTDPTGSADAGGDWQLEFATGEIESTLAPNNDSPSSWAGILPVNTAPTLDNTKNPTLTAENEDSGAPVGAVGTLVSSLVDFASPAGQVDNVSDPDAGALLGIAVTAADAAAGSWWYSIDGGVNWNALGSVSETNARLLSADGNTRLYFQPNADWNGSLASAITFRAWDQTSGINGGTADLASPPIAIADSFTTNNYSGGTGWAGNWVEIGEATDSAAGNVKLMTAGQVISGDSNYLEIHLAAGMGIERAVNLSGAATASLSFYYEETDGSAGGQVAVQSWDGASWTTLQTIDIDISNAVGGANGVFTGQLNIPNPSTVTKIRLNVAQAAAGDVIYVDDIQVNSPGGSGTGGSTAFSSATDTASLTVNAVNDAPVITSNGGGATALINIPENTTAVTTVTSTDVDGGTPSYSIVGGADAANFAIDGTTGTLALIGAPDFENPSDANLDNVYEVAVQVSDGNGGTDTQAIGVNVTNVVEIFNGPGAAIWSQAGLATPQTADFNGYTFSQESATANIGGPWRVIAGAESPMRDEKIVVGVDAGGNISGQVWSGGAWTAFAFNDMATVSDSTALGFAVAYESLSGDAVMVWNNGTSGTAGLSYRVWNGTSWTAAQTITTPLAGEPVQMRLAAAPNADEMVLVVGTAGNDDYALVWNGSSWGNGQVLDTSVAANYHTDVAVAYEAVRGEAVVVYGDGSRNLSYRIWDGLAWSSASTLVAPGGAAGELRWTTLAADPNSDRIALGVRSASGETWLSVWSGTAWGSTLLAATTETQSDFLGVGVAFESTSGDALAVYSDNNNQFRFRTWTSAGGWSVQQNGADLGDKVRTITLSSRPRTDQIVASVLDAGGDVNFPLWDGSTWSAKNEQENNSGETVTRPFLFLWDRDKAAEAATLRSGLWLSTAGDVNSNGAGGLNSWTAGTVLGFGDPDLYLEPVSGTTSGTLSRIFNIDDFAGDANVDAIHYVTRDITLGASSVQLRKGDVLLSTSAAETLVSTNTLNVDDRDVFVFRPDVAGNYSAGTFMLLLKNPTGAGVRGVSLIEQSTTVGDVTLQAGDFLLADGKDVLLFETTDVGPSSTSGTLRTLLRGGDANVGIAKNIEGIELIETTQTIGGYSLAAGTILLTVDVSTQVGSNNLPVEKFDVFALTVAQTTLVAGSGNGSASATMILQGTDIGLQSGGEEINGLTTIPTVNAAPQITSNGGGPAASVSVVERTVVATTVTSSDVDGGTPLYSIVGGADAAKFTIGASSGVLSFVAAPDYEAPADAGANNVYDVTVQVSDGNGGTDTQAIAVTVTDLAEAVVVGNRSSSAALDTSSLTWSHTVASGSDRILLVNIAVRTDVPVSSVTYGASPLTLVGAQVDSTGKVRAELWALLAPAVGSQNVTVTLAGNARFVAGATDFSNVSQSLPYGSVTTGQGSGDPSLTVASAAGELVVDAVADRDVDTAAVGPNQGVLWTNSTGTASKDAWGGSSIENGAASVTMSWTTSGQGAGEWAAVVLSLKPYVNTPPAITSNGAGAAAAVNVAENATAVTTVTAIDADVPAQPLTYAISGGADAAKFTINPSTGALAFASAPDYESPTDSGANNVYDVTVQVSDGNGGIDSQAIAVTVTPVNDNAPLITSNGGGAMAAVSVAENSTAVTTVTASDADLPAQTLTYSISGGVDAAKFTINPTTGVLAFAAAPDYELPTDAGANNVYDVTVQVSDGAGGTDTQAIAVAVTPVNDNAPVITSNGGGATASVSMAENATAVTTVTASDADLPAQSLAYAIVGGADAARFTIDATTGVLRFATAPDFEAPADVGSDNVYDVIVRASDGAMIDDQAISVTVTNLPRTLDRFTSVSYSGNDGDQDWLGNWTEQGGGWDPSRGVVRVSASGYADIGGDNVSIAGRALVRTADLTGATSAFLSFGYQRVNISGGGGSVSAEVSSDGGATWSTLASYSLSAFDGTFKAAKFDISAFAGSATQVRFIGSGSTSASFRFDDVEIEHNGAAANHAPAITSDGGGDAAALARPEGGTAVTTVTASDADVPAQTLTYSITGGDDAARFTIDPATGVLSFAVAPDFEAPADANLDNVYEVLVQVDDGTGGSDAQLISVTVTDRNDAPVLDASRTPVLASVDEDAGAPVGPVGTPIAALVDFANPAGGVDNVSDADAGALLGVAITAADTTHGSWWITTDGGASWSALGAVSDASARLLAADANTRLQFQPDADFSGSIAGAISFRAWDRSSGANGGLADATVNGGATAFSAASDTASIDVNPFNDAPVLDASGTMVLTTITEDQVANIGDQVSDIIASAGGDRITDADAGAVEGIALTSTSSGNGTWQYSTDGGATWSDVGTVSDGGALLLCDVDRLRFVPDGLNADAASVSFRAWDRTSGTSGTKVDVSVNGSLTAFSLATANANITVTAVNDAPVITSGPQSGAVVEDGVQSASGQVIASDVDTGATLSYGGGATSAYGSFVVDAATGAWTYTLDNAAAQPLAAGQTVVETFTVSVSDGAGGSASQDVSVTISGTNDVPVITSGGPSGAVVEDGVQTAGGQVSASDVDGGATLSYGGSAAGAYGSFGVDAATGTWTYTLDNAAAQPLAAGQTVVETFTVSVSDGVGGSTSQPVSVTVSGTNDAPTVTVSAGDAAYTEKAPAVAVDPALVLGDVDGTMLTGALVRIAAGFAAGQDQLGFTATANISGTWDATSGVLTLSGTAGIAEYEAALRSVSYSNTSADPDTTPRTVEFTVDDGLAPSAPASRTVTVEAVNDAPVNVLPGGWSTAEDTSVQLTGLRVGDVDAGASPLVLTLQVGSGTLSAAAQGGVAVSGSGTAVLTMKGTRDALNAYLAGSAAPVFAPQPDFNGEVTLWMNSSDLGASGIGGALGDDDSATITVTPVNDAPVITSGGGAAQLQLQVAESTTAVTTLQATDVDVPAQPLVYEIVGGQDAAMFAVDAQSGALRWALSPDYEAPADANRDNVYEVVVQVSDSAGATAQQRLTVRVQDANDAPRLQLPDAVQLMERAGDGTVVARAQASDQDGGDTLRFSLVDNGNGRFAIVPATGTIVVADGLRLDAWEQSEITLVVQVTDAQGATTQRALKVRLLGAPPPVPTAPNAPAPAADRVQPDDAPAKKTEEPQRAPAAADLLTPTRATSEPRGAPRVDPQEDDGVTEAVRTLVDSSRPRGDPAADATLAQAGSQLMPGTPVSFELTPSLLSEGLNVVMDTAADVASLIGRAWSTVSRGSSGEERPDDDVFKARNPADDRTPVEQLLLTLTQPAHVTGVTLTAGLVWWITRGGGLVATALMGVPAWRQVDLLPVIARDDDDDDDDDDEDEWSGEADELFEAGAAGAPAREVAP